MSILEVAKLAGVSASTVSRVVNNDPRVAAGTAAVVQKVVRDLQLRPASRRRHHNGNGSGRHVAGGTIAFLVFGASRSSATPGFEMLLRCVSAAANERGFSLVLNFVSDLRQVSRRMREAGLGGILCHGEQPESPELHRLQALPTVWLMANRRRPQWGDQVMPNNAAIGQMAACYLLGRGHRRLAYLGVAPEAWSMRLRCFAFSNAVEEAGAEISTFHAGHDAGGDYWSVDGLATATDAAVQRILESESRPTALFVEEDRLLPLVDRALRRRGINTSAGGEMEIISCNKEEPHYQGLSVQPARIDIRLDAIGRRGVEQLVWRMHNDDVPERFRVMIEPQLIAPAAMEINAKFAHSAVN